MYKAQMQISVSAVKKIMLMKFHIFKPENNFSSDKV